MGSSLDFARDDAVEAVLSASLEMTVSAVPSTMLGMTLLEMTVSAVLSTMPAELSRLRSG